jgi:hypothetical protein
MQKLTREELMPLEKYAEVRKEFRQQVMDHKRLRTVFVGDHAALYFEDRMTMQYQIQEMLRVERIFEAEGIQEELDAYNPLIPDGKNWKVTFMMQYEDVNERQAQLAKLINIEDRVWVQVEGLDRVLAIADEDLDRDTDEKTSSVHFLRFELTDQMCAAVKEGAAITVGIDHDLYAGSTKLPPETRDALAADLD